MWVMGFVNYYSQRWVLPQDAAEDLLTEPLKAARTRASRNPLTLFL